MWVGGTEERDGFGLGAPAVHVLRLWKFYPLLLLQRHCDSQHSTKGKVLSLRCFAGDTCFIFCPAFSVVLIEKIGAISSLSFIKAWDSLSNLSLSLYFPTSLFLYISSLWLLLRFCLLLLKVYFVYFIDSFYLCYNWKIWLIYVTVITNLFGFILDILNSFFLSFLFFLCIHLETIPFYFLYILETWISVLKVIQS